MEGDNAFGADFHGGFGDHAELAVTNKDAFAILAEKAKAAL